MSHIELRTSLALITCALLATALTRSQCAAGEVKPECYFSERQVNAAGPLVEAVLKVLPEMSNRGRVPNGLEAPGDQEIAESDLALRFLDRYLETTRVNWQRSDRDLNQLEVCLDLYSKGEETSGSCLRRAVEIEVAAREAQRHLVKNSECGSFDPDVRAGLTKWGERIADAARLIVEASLQRILQTENERADPGQSVSRSQLSHAVCEALDLEIALLEANEALEKTINQTDKATGASNDLKAARSELCD